MYNPYAPKKQAVVANTGAPLTSGVPSVPRAMGRTWNGKVVASSQPIVNSQGQFNGATTQDIMLSQQALQQGIATGSVKTRTMMNHEVKATHERMLAAALNDKTGNAWMALGEVMGDQIWETLGRDGFSRQTLLLKELGKGEVGRFQIRKKDVVAYYVTSAAPTTIASQVRQFWVYPPDFYITANIQIEDKEIAQSPGDLLEDKFQDGLEQIMVAEDKVWLTMARTAAPTYNDLVFYNTFTPDVFTNLRTSIAEWGIPVSTAIIAFDIWNDIISDPQFTAWFDPVTQHEIVLEGSVGSIQGVQILTDAYRYPTLKVMDRGEVYMLGAPQTLGGITQRSPLQTTPINRYAFGEPKRGWFMEQIEGMAIVNPRALIRGQRV
jgi:hypothetical protein